MKLDTEKVSPAFEQGIDFVLDIFSNASRHCNPQKTKILHKKPLKKTNFYSKDQLKIKSVTCSTKFKYSTSILGIWAIQCLDCFMLDKHLVGFPCMRSRKYVKTLADISMVLGFPLPNNSLVRQVILLRGRPARSLVQGTWTLHE